MGLVFSPFLANQPINISPKMKKMVQNYVSYKKHSLESDLVVMSWQFLHIYVIFLDVSHFKDRGELEF